MRGGEDAHNEINVDELKFIGMWNKNIQYNIISYCECQKKGS